MPSGITRILVWLLFGFAVYAIFTSPDRAADIAVSIWDLIEEGFRNIGRFFEAIIGA
jgi:hypothetical protein